MKETQAFDILLGVGAASQMVLYTFPVAGIHIYIANFLSVAAACGMFSAWLIVLEKRVPRKN